MAERAGELQFHAHAAGEGLDLCLGLQAESINKAAERFVTLGGVGGPHGAFDLGNLERGREGAGV